MEEQRFVLPSNVYPSQHSTLDPVRPRLPLTDSTGNAQYHNVATANIYNDQKGLQPRPPPNFTLPTLPSQPARQYPQRSSLEARRSHIRAQKANRSSKANPIIESEHYQLYRSRQVKESGDDKKWPDDLEELFLEALLLLPEMGRRKFSLNGRPHGRNELISLYLWMGHCESLAPGQKPDPSRQRTRKQVSSHIQVLKGFMRGHPAFDRLFPSKNSSKDSFVEDSFKNDPCLRALAQGRLPSKRSSHLDFRPSLGGQPPRHLASTNRQSSLSPIQTSQMLSSSNQSLKPALFRMYMTTLLPGVKYEDVPETDAEDGKLSTRAHTYSDSIPRAMGYSILDTLPNWRTRFPILAQIQARNELKCDVIHLDVSLELRYGSLPERSELWGKFEVLVPGKHNRQSVWRCTQSLHKPADLYGSPSTDPRYENMNSVPHVVRYEPGVGTHLRVSFPASPWAHALERLSTMEAQFEEAVQTGAPLPTPTTARQYIDQITMFQELYCSDAPNQPFTRRAILLWTFKKCKAGEQGQASWRYLDPLPPRSACFSPHPGTNHVVSAVMTENFGNWADNMSPSLNLSAAPNPFDSLSQYEELPTPVSTMTGAGQMQYSFPSFGYSPADNLSFISHETQDSDATLVDVQNGANGVHMDSFLSTNGVLGSFDQSQNLWEAPPIQSFDNDVSFLANYGPTPSSAGPQVWEAGDGKHAEWEAADASYPTYDAHLSQRQK